VTLTAANLGLVVNDGDNNRVVVDYSDSPLAIAVGGTTRNLDLDGSLGESTFVTGTMTLGVADFFHATGTATFRKSLGNVMLANGEAKSVELLSLSLANASGFAGVRNGAVDRGLTLTGVNASYAFAADASDGDRYWNALQASASTVTATGLDGVTLSASDLAVEINRPDSTGQVIDWASLPLSVSSDPAAPSLDMDGQLGSLVQASGTFAIGVNGFFQVGGSLALRRSSGSVTLADASNTTTAVDLLTIGGQGLSAFAGVNGGTANAVGMALSGVDFALALASSQADPTRKWTALSASAASSSFSGVPGVSLSGSNLAVNINRPDTGGTAGASAAAVIDFAASPLAVPTGTGLTRTLSMDGDRGALLEVAGRIAVDLGGFFTATGDLALTKSTAQVTPTGGSATAVDLLTIGASDLNGFVGLNGGGANAVGLRVGGVELAVAIATSQADPTLKWTAATAGASSTSFEGLPEVGVQAENLFVSVNRPNSAGVVLDLAASPLTVATGPSSSRTLSLAGSDGALLEAGGTLRLEVGDFFHVGGSFAVRRSDATVTLQGGQSAAVDLLTVGGSGLSAFAGVNAGTANQLGMGLDGVEFALAVASLKSDSSRVWTAVDATAGTAALQGIDGLTLSGSNLGVSINRPDKNGVLIDFAAAPLTVRTGPSTTRSLDLTGQSGPLLEVSGALALDVSGFFTASGTFALRKSTGTITLDDASTKNVDLLTIGAANITAFAGSNGASSERTGLSLGGVEFALAIASDQASPSNVWTTLQASA
jgi:hypothetical protein